MTLPPDTLGAVRRFMAQQLRNGGFDTPELDARVLLGDVLKLDHTSLVASADRPLTPAEQQQVLHALARRLAHEPVARIVGIKEFWGLPFALNAETLVPRPDSETLIEAALAAAGPDRHRALRIADLGTGTGALLLALLREWPAAHGVGTDISKPALACAAGNAAALRLTHRAAFVCCDQGAALAGGFDIVVANPPYLATADIDRVEPEVRLFDPRRALDGGPDGLDAYRAIAADARRLVTPGGSLILELGEGLAEAVTTILAAAGMSLAGPVRPDLAGVPRALVARPRP